MQYLQDADREGSGSWNLKWLFYKKCACLVIGETLLLTCSDGHTAMIESLQAS